MWLIVGTLPDADLPLTHASVTVEGKSLLLHSLTTGQTFSVPVERGTAALAASAWQACRALGVDAPRVLVAGDQGSGAGSRAVYAHLVQHASAIKPLGLTFHYLFPDVDWHNRVLMAVQGLEQPPLLVADAGFMYVAKMSGYADAYDIFTPDIGEMAFLADEKAPHPFYTRGFLLESEDTVPELLARAREHGNVPRHLIIKGSVDHVVDMSAGVANILTVREPSVPAMEAIGGTGDLVTGLLTAYLCAGLPTGQAALLAARTNRRVAALAVPTPATQLAELLTQVPEAVRVTVHESASTT